MAGKMKFRLKAGSHTEGVGAGQRVYKSNDPTNCIIETDQDLAAFDPNKFEPYIGPLKARGLRGAEITAGSGKDAPPPPTPDDFARAEAAARTSRTVPMSADTAKRRAEELRRQADELEQHAKQTEDALKESMEDEEEEEEEEKEPGEGDEEAQLEDLKVQELRDLAESEEIDLKGSTTKADIIKSIRQARKDQEEAKPAEGADK